MAFWQILVSYIKFLMPRPLKSGGAGGAMASPDFGILVCNNPISTRGSDYAPTSLLAPSNFQTFLRPAALVHQMVSLTSNFKPMNINYDFFFYFSNWKELWKKSVKTSNEFVIGPVWARSLQIVFKEMEQISNYFEIHFYFYFSVGVSYFGKC